MCIMPTRIIIIIEPTMHNNNLRAVITLQVLIIISRTIVVLLGLHYLLSLDHCRQLRDLTNCCI